MRHLNSNYNDFINEAKFFKRKSNKKPEILSFNDIENMTPEERDEYRKKLEEESKKLKEISKQNKLIRRAESKDMDDELNKTLKQYIDKDYSFQYSQYVWKSNNSNYEEIDVADFIFKGINVEPSYDLNSDIVKKVFFILNFIDRYGNLIEVPLFEYTPINKIVDLEYANLAERSNKVMRGNFDDDDIDYDDPSSYPKRHCSIDLVPNDYKTIELLKEIKFLLKEINENLYK
jgi:hypothetical protein